VLRWMIFGLLGIAGPAPAHAELARAIITPMTAASDDVCELLKSDRHDRCTSLAHDGNAIIYTAGSKRGIRRFVLAIDRGGDEDVLVGPPIDLDQDAKPSLKVIGGSAVMQVADATVTCSVRTLAVWTCETRRQP
jgi:hypothetical protein